MTECEFLNSVLNTPIFKTFRIFCKQQDHSCPAEGDNHRFNHAESHKVNSLLLLITLGGVGEYTHPQNHFAVGTPRNTDSETL